MTKSLGTMLRGGLVALSLGLAAAPAAAQVTNADGVCASNANPCNVTSVIDVAPNATLDFGTRSVVVSGSGQFNFDINSGQILSGNFTATTTNPAIKANGAAPAGGTASGSVFVKARRLCSGSGSIPCVDLPDCALGACDSRRCSKRPTKKCAADGDCQLGTCGLNKRCSGSTTFVRCNTNADCDYGTCPAQLTCASLRFDKAVNCSANTDCDAGTCSVGNASIAMNGPIAGNSGDPATIVLRAADNVTVSKSVNLNSATLGSDGGDLTIDAATGSIAISAAVTATGGGDSQGGTVELNAGQDVTLTDTMTLNGGDFDGGALEITAGRDISVAKSILANSVAGAGFGGEIIFDAGRDLTVTGASALNRTTIETSGHTDIENFAGDGGTQDMTTGRHMTLGANTRLLGTGSIPDGYGSDMFFDASGNLTMSGEVSAKSDGLKGAGGFVEVLAGGTTQVTSTASLIATGGDGGGGVIEFESLGNVDFAGMSDVSGASGGPGGSMFVDADATVTVSGTLFVSGTNGGSNEVDGCRVTLASGGKLDNNVSNGDNKILARESMKLLSGSEMTTGVSGQNTLVYRTAAKPPLIQGLVSPAPVKIVDEDLVGCPVCGNLEVDDGETCDDGNFNNGDGCSSACQNEKCLQQTISPGYPTVAICEDGNACTADVCNTALNGGTCQHPAKNCADAFPCTADSCEAQTGNCLHVPNNSLCNDGNVCTDDVCTVQSGCGGVANTDPCNDTNACTENDICADKICTGTPIQGCGFCGDGFINDTEQCDDGNATFTSGEYCGEGCVLIPCGKPTNSSGTLPKASDALFTLKAAVGQGTCHLRVCDVDNSTKVLASDALRILRKAVGQTVTLNCPVS